MKEIRLKEFLEKGRIEAGCDEAGRGPLAGPVFTAAVILPENFFGTGDTLAKARLNDSKQMTEKSRNELRTIIEAEADWAVEAVSPEEIDFLNILWASVKGMQRAVMKLKRRPDFLLIDGNKFRPFGGFPYQTVVHGDATFASIAAASVLAKTHRDAFMRKLAETYPEYGWERNFGYPTKEHLEAIKKFGLTPWHRRSFRPKSLEPSLFD